MNGAETILEVRHLKQYFGKQDFRAVDDISFTVRRGEVVGIVGESGCGKTTTGRSIIRLNNATSGDVYFKGQRIVAGTRSYTDPIASLDPRMTVREIIAEGLRIQGIRDPEYIDRRVFEMLERVGLVREHAGRYPHEFSGGQR